MDNLIVGIDFDGTCVTHEYPFVGKEIGAPRILRALHEAGALFILWTMRTNNELVDAINWFNSNRIPLWGINSNPDQHAWTSSPKAYAHIYIDDAALGCPLKFDKALSNRPFVDWNKAGDLLVERGLISKDSLIDNTEALSNYTETG